MKLQPETIVFLVVVAGVTIGAVVLAKKVSNGVGGAIDGAVQSVKDLANAVLEAPGKAVDAVVQGAKEGGATWEAGRTPVSPIEQEMTNKRFPDPLINNDGMDFGQLSG